AARRRGAVANISPRPSITARAAVPNLPLISLSPGGAPLSTLTRRPVYSPRQRRKAQQRLRMAPATRLEYRNVTMRFADAARGGLTAVADVNLRVADPGGGALVGPRGGGNSTPRHTAARRSP